MKSIDLDTCNLPPVMSTRLCPAIGTLVPPTVMFHIASDDPADIRIWAEALGAEVEMYAPREVAGGWMACASVDAEANGMRIEVWQAWPVAAPALETQAVAR